MTRPTHAALRAEGVEAERQRVLAFFDRQMRDVALLEEAGRIDCDSGQLLRTRLQTIADQVAEGLHDG